MFCEKQMKLPASLKDSETAKTIKNYLSCLTPSSSYFSFLLYAKNDKFRFLLKGPTFPFIPFDWTIYTLMRVRAKTIVTSGPTLRVEKQIYGKERGTFGNDQLQKIYEENTQQPFNLLVYTSSMEEKQIKQIICDKHFKYIPIKELGPVKDNLKQIAQRANELKMGPIIYENGQASMGKAMHEVKQNEKNFIEMILLSVYEGEMPEKYIGGEYDASIIYRDFEKVWESEAINSTAKHDDGSEKPIKLKYHIYLRKDIAKKNKEQK